MKWTSWVFGFLTLAVLAGCGGDRRDSDTGTSGAGAETGTMQGDAATTDTAAPSTGTGLNSDTANADAQMHGDTHGKADTTNAGHDSAGGANH